MSEAASDRDTYNKSICYTRLGKNVKIQNFRPPIPEHEHFILPKLVISFLVRLEVLMVFKKVNKHQATGTIFILIYLPVQSEEKPDYTATIQI